MGAAPSRRGGAHPCRGSHYGVDHCHFARAPVSARSSATMTLIARPSVHGTVARSGGTATRTPYDPRRTRPDTSQLGVSDSADAGGQRTLVRADVAAGT